MPCQPTCSAIQFSRYGLAVFHRSRSGSSWRPRPSMLSRVFCSSTSCGCTSTLKRREVWNKRSNIWPKEISLSGRSKIGSQQAHGRFQFIHPGFLGRPARLDVGFGHTLVVAPEEGQEILRQIIFVEIIERADDAEIKG